MGHTYQTVIDAINCLLTDASLQSCSASVVDRLVSLGYMPNTTDAFTIAFVMDKSKMHILNQINDSAIPDGLICIFVDMACGEFLRFKSQTGTLVLSGLNFDGIVQTVSEGDTSVTFAAEGSDEAKFNALVDWLITGRSGDLICYRKIKW